MKKILVIDGATYLRTPHYQAMDDDFVVFRASSFQQVLDMRDKLHEFHLIFLNPSFNSHPHFVENPHIIGLKLYWELLKDLPAQIVVWANHEHLLLEGWGDRVVRKEIFHDRKDFFINIAREQLHQCA